jgi:hypothetical protein
MSLYKTTKYCISVQHILLSFDISSSYAFLVQPKRKTQKQHGAARVPEWNNLATGGLKGFKSPVHSRHPPAPVRR